MKNAPGVFEKTFSNILSYAYFYFAFSDSVASRSSSEIDIFSSS